MTRPSSLQGRILKVNCAAREGALGYKVNCAAREGALGYKVNRRQAREGALGYKVNCAAREGALGYSVYRKAMSAHFRTHSEFRFLRHLAQTDVQLA